jgi:hypothetical protein
MVKSLACQILNHHNIRLYHIQVSGVDDGADSGSNIRDTCNGGSAKRSNYGNAPGGRVCLSAAMLRTLKAVADSSPVKIQVNCLAGGSHTSESSKHYLGTAFDLQKYNGWDEWVETCESRGGTAYHPGDRGHSHHVHCEL